MIAAMNGTLAKGFRSMTGAIRGPPQSSIRRQCRATYSTGVKVQEPGLKERLKGIRELMHENGLAAYIVSSADAHQSEYVADCDKHRAFLSGFDGSAGTAIVTRDAAALWTDGRYFLQAEQQLCDDWILMRSGNKGVETQEQWLKNNLEEKEVVGYDPWCTSINELKNFKRAFRRSLSVKAVDENLVGEIWSNRPARVKAPIRSLESEFAGESTSDKIKKVQHLCKNERAGAVVLTALDEIAWIFNLRGADIPFNPVFFSFGLITEDSAILFADKSQFAEEVEERLDRSGVQIYPYEDITTAISELVDHLQDSSHSRVWMDPAKCCMKLRDLVPDDKVLLKDSPVSLLKAVKNESEIEGMRQCHITDAVAMIEHLSWLEQKMISGQTVTEISAADKLEEFRSKGDHFVGLSFETISSSGPNGAIIHYAPSVATNRKLSLQEVYLFDSGAQYKNGTTDVTRSITFSQPTSFEREAFTRVLQGHLALGRAVFPSTTVGPKLDILARVPLWELGLDYAHGTGHGVGSFLNVHEGPHGINSHLHQTTMLATPLRPGMMVTNEPGYYHDGHFGIRIENVMLVVPAATEHNFQGTKFFAFEQLTLVPYQHKMIDVFLLTQKEIDQVDSYHQRILHHLSGRLSEGAQEWLERSCCPI